MKRVVILGSTGSIGQSALEVIKCFPDEFRVLALSANSNIDLLYRQAKVYHPEYVCVNQKNSALELNSRLKSGVKVLFGPDGLSKIINTKGVDIVLLAISGAAALSPLLETIESGISVALANKEALVMAGPIIIKRALEKKVKIIPIDSEQSAIWQCLEGQEKRSLKNIYLTASGGPLRNTQRAAFKNISVKQVLKHPRWKMGKKITVDSATLMNKGLELLEAMYLFDTGPDKIKILIHPQAIIHSMVEFIDGVLLAQLSATDMRIPIQYALSYPKRLPNRIKAVDFYRLKELNFEKPNFKKFPCLGLAYQAAREEGTAPCVLNAANEVSVAEFLQGKIKFMDIPKVIEKVLEKHQNIKQPDLNEIKLQDSWARRQAYRIIGGLKG